MRRRDHVGHRSVAYCVALWEALAGERPYRGPNPDDLRRQVLRGPDALDTRRIPLRLRSILRRGLDPDPARRWPSMVALLARLENAKRRPRAAIGVGALALVAGIAAVLRLDSAVTTTCESPARGVAVEWAHSIALEMRARLAGNQSPNLAPVYMDGWAPTPRRARLRAGSVTTSSRASTRPARGSMRFARPMRAGVGPAGAADLDEPGPGGLP